MCGWKNYHAADARQQEDERDGQLILKDMQTKLISYIAHSMSP
jgi:hypothetical protein